DVEWVFKPAKAAVVDALPAVRIPLRAVDFLDEFKTVLALPKDKQAFVVYLNSGQPYVCKVQACNLQSGRVESSAVFAEGESPIAISPDGAIIVSQKPRHSFSNEAELRLYSREGNKVKPLKTWKPFVTPGSNEWADSRAVVSWAVFTDSQHVL